MTAAIRSNRAAPMTVARAGGEGSPIQVTPSFRSLSSFGPKESSITRAMSTVTQSPLAREIRIGTQPAPRLAFASNFSNPDRVQGMNRIKIAVPYTGTVLDSVHKPREIAKTTPSEQVRTHQPEVITLFDRPKIKEHETKIPEHLSTVPNNDTLTTPTDTLAIHKEKSALVSAQSLESIRKQLQLITSPSDDTEHRDASRVIVTPREKTVITYPRDKHLSPLEIVAKKNIKKDVSMTSRISPVIASDIVQHEQNRNMMTNEVIEKDIEKKLLTKYLQTYVLSLNQNEIDEEQKAYVRDVAKRMTTYLTKTVYKDDKNHKTIQILDDAETVSEKNAIKKIEELVSETRVTMTRAIGEGTDVALIEKKALLMLHLKIQEAGILKIFTKIKTTVTDDVKKEAAVTSNAGTHIKGANKTHDEEHTKEISETTQNHPKIELDTFADRLRRAFMKSRAQRAFDKAKERGQKKVTTSEIAKEIGTYQYQFIKSKPVRYTEIPDGSITETLLELRTQNVALTTVDEAKKIIDAKIDQKAPVRITHKVRTQRKGLLDLMRVFGYQEQPKPKTAMSM